MNLPLPLLITIERAIDAVLRIDPDTRARLSAINGKVVRVNVGSPRFSVLLSVTDGHVHLDQSPDEDHQNEPADVTITGSIRNLRSLLDGNDAVYSGAVQIEGDIGVSQQLKQIMAQLDPDWQDAVSPYLGDGLTHRLDVVQSSFSAWLKRTRESFRANTGEYLQEEIEVLAPDSQIKVFCEEVDDTRAAADRLDARIRQLESLSDSHQRTALEDGASC